MAKQSKTALIEEAKARIFKHMRGPVYLYLEGEHLQICWRRPVPGRGAKAYYETRVGNLGQFERVLLEDYGYTDDPFSHRAKNYLFYSVLEYVDNCIVAGKVTMKLDAAVKAAEKPAISPSTSPREHRA